MGAIHEIVPLRCQGCYLFYEDIEKSAQLQAEKAILEEESNREKLIKEHGVSMEEIQRYIGSITFELDDLRQKLQNNLFYTVGCPGVDMGESLDTGSTVSIARCKSPIFDLE